MVIIPSHTCLDIKHSEPFRSQVSLLAFSGGSNQIIVVPQLLREDATCTWGPIMEEESNCSFADCSSIASIMGHPPGSVSRAALGKETCCFSGIYTYFPFLVCNTQRIYIKYQTSVIYKSVLYQTPAQVPHD